ncbi:MAG: nuclear transport factor 2 family protein [Roseobacter sp.]
MTRAPVPPFTYEDAVKKVRMAENAWNTRDPANVAQAYTPDTKWRNRSQFLTGRAEVEDFLTHKWSGERDYRLIKEIWAFADTRIAVRFCYEYQDSAGNWFRAFGNENWEFDEGGYMAVRHASINDVSIAEKERLFLWPQGPRPEDHPGLTELGL